MARRSKNNPFTYDLEGLRESHFDHRSLKRYKSKYPKKRKINKWSPNYDIHLIGMDLLKSEKHFPIDSLSEHLGNHFKESEIKHLIENMARIYHCYVPRGPYTGEDLEDFEFPKWVVVFTNNPRDNISQFSRLLLTSYMELMAFISTKENFDLTLDFYLEELEDVPYPIKMAFRNYIEETFYPCFDQLNKPSKLPQIVYGFSTTLYFDEQLTPMMLLHELSEILGAFYMQENGYIDLRELVEDDEEYSIFVPSFSSSSLEERIVPQLIERREVLQEFFTRYLVHGELRLKDVKSNAPEIGADEIRMLVANLNILFPKIIEHFLQFNAPLFMRI